MGKAAFFNVQDDTGDFQCYIRRDDFSKNSETSDTTSPQPPKPSENKHEKYLKAQNNPLNPWELWKLCDNWGHYWFKRHNF